MRREPFTWPREVLWPGEMSPRWTDVVNAAVRRAREDLSGKVAGHGDTPRA